MVMPNARRLTQQSKPILKLRPYTLGGIVLRFAGKNERPLHRLTALARRRSWIISRSSSKTSSPSINSPRSA